MTAVGAARAAVADRPALARAGRCRQQLAAAFLPADQTAVPGWVLAVVTLGCGALAVTRLGAAGLNTFWAEDGQVFYQGALNHPLSAFFESYRGYLVTASRLVGSVVALFPVSQAAAVDAVADALALGLLAAVVYRACGEHIRSPWVRAVPAVVTAVCPLGQETWGAAADLQWPMFFAAFAVLLWNPRRPAAIAAGAVTVALAALTGPFGLLLVPLAAARVAVLGRGRGWVIPLAFLAGVVVQLAAMAAAGGRQTASAILPPGLVESRYAAFIAGQGFFGTRYPLPWLPLGNAVVIAMLGALVLVAAAGRLRSFALAALALAYSAGFFTLLMVLVNGADQGYTLRYNVAPFLLLAYAVAVLLDAGLRGGTGLRGGAGWRAGRIRTAARWRLAGLARFAALALTAVLVGCLAWSVAANWNLSDPARRQPTWTGALASARSECSRGARAVQVPITPAGKHPWDVTLTCAQLGPS